MMHLCVAAREVLHMEEDSLYLYLLVLSKYLYLDVKWKLAVWKKQETGSLTLWTKTKCKTSANTLKR